MIPTNTPWSGLESGKTDTRRFDARARWNWFWAVMPGAEAALVLQLSNLPSPAPKLPDLRSLEIRFQTLPGGPILYIRLKDGAQLELFETLCRDVVSAGELAGDEGDALARAIGRTFRWHRLLRDGGPSGVLSEEEQKGLIGEIRVLRMLMAEIGAKAALDAWSGPSGAPKDFELTGGCIEVKARRAASQPHVKISNEFQLADVPNHRLWLAVVAVDRVAEPHGQTLSDIVAEVGREIEQASPAALAEWEIRLSEVGFDSGDEYEAWRWNESDLHFYTVTSAFPRIASPIPVGLTNVSYSIALSACAPFQTEWDDVKAHAFLGAVS